MRDRGTTAPSLGCGSPDFDPNSHGYTNCDSDTWRRIWRITDTDAYTAASGDTGQSLRPIYDTDGDTEQSVWRVYDAYADGDTRRAVWRITDSDGRAGDANGEQPGPNR